MYQLHADIADTEHSNFTNIFRVFSVVQTANGLTEEQQNAEELQKFEQVCCPFDTALKSAMSVLIVAADKKILVWRGYRLYTSRKDQSWYLGCR